jgi:hypothetical protein
LEDDVHNVAFDAEELDDPGFQDEEPGWVEEERSVGQGGELALAD